MLNLCGKDAETRKKINELVEIEDRYSKYNIHKFNERS